MTCEDSAKVCHRTGLAALAYNPRMPIYEYRCESCETRFEAFIQGEQRPACTSCGGRRLEKLLSTFAVSASSGATPSFPMPSGGGCGTCGDPRGPGSCKSDG